MQQHAASQPCPSQRGRRGTSTTLWRTVADHGAKDYYFELVLMPTVIWADLKKIDLKAGSQPKRITVAPGATLSGDVSAKFEPVEPLKSLGRES